MVRFAVVRDAIRTLRIAIARSATTVKSGLSWPREAGRRWGYFGWISFSEVIHRARWAVINGNGEPVANAQVKSWWYRNRISPFLPWAVVPIGRAGFGGCGQTRPGQRDAAGQQGPANDPLQNVRGVHSVSLRFSNFRWAPLPFPRALVKFLRSPDCRSVLSQPAARNASAAMRRARRTDTDWSGPASLS